MKNTVVLGAGIAGLVAAKILLDKGYNVTVLETSPAPGGMLKSRNIDGLNVDIGPFFHFSKPLFDIFPEAQECFEPAHPIVRTITPKYSIDQFPLTMKMFLKDYGYLGAATALFSFYKDKIFINKDKNAVNYCKYYMGNRLFVMSGIRHYISRLFNEDPNKISTSFAITRMKGIETIKPMQMALSYLKPNRTPAPEEPLDYILVVKKEEFLYQEVFEKIACSLKTKGVNFIYNADIEKIDYKNEKPVIAFKHGENLETDHIFSTIPINKVIKLTGVEHDGFDSVELTTLYFRTKFDHDFDVLHNHSFTGNWKRITNFNRLYKKNLPKDIIALEITHKKSNKINIEEEAKKFAKEGMDMNLFNSTPELVTSDYTPDAYPIMLQKDDKELDKVREMTAARKITITGRHGNFNVLSVARSVDAMRKQIGEATK